MSFVLIFACLLLLAVLLSGLAERSVLSAAAMFLVGGFLCGHGVGGAIHFEPDNPAVGLLAELALFSVLFTDGMRLRLADLGRVWTLPGRALLLGMPFTFAGIALLARYLLNLDWRQSFLIGAVLSPTDPVFASAIVGREEIPYRVRQLLNVESGVNDGLALPLVMWILGGYGQEDADLAPLLAELAGGVALGAVAAFIAAWLERRAVFDVSESRKPLFSFAVAALILSLAKQTGANEYLAAFAGGAVLGNIHPTVRDAFHQSGERITELLKLAAVFAFGALISPDMLSDISWQGCVFTFAVIFIARTTAMMLALAFSELSWGERVVAAWFGPKGFASVIYGIMVLKSAMPNAVHMFEIIAVVIASSILLHSSTDVPFVRWFRDRSG